MYRSTPHSISGTPDPSHPVADNVLQQDFTAEAPNERWASDITYISTQQGWLYLAVVMDLYSRRIVGWSMSRWISRHLAIDALKMAIDQRLPEGSLIHHSDRGSQYTSDDFRDELEKHGIQCSMSARGNCYDNAVVESFFGLLKRERVNRAHYLTRDEAKADVFDYIERFYNRKRRHGRLVTSAQRLSKSAPEVNSKRSTKPGQNHCSIPMLSAIQTGKDWTC